MSMWEEVEVCEKGLSELPLKVHKREKFFVSDFEFFTIF
jgi:hypothetical protein